MPYILKKVGFVLGTHGYKGLLRLKLEEDLNNKEYLFILIEEKGVPFFIEERLGEDIVKLRLINSVDEAQKLTGLPVAVEDKSPTPSAESLEGFKIEIQGKEQKGTIASLDKYPQGLMMNCLIEGEPVLIPYVKEWFLKIDKELKVIYLDLPEGLLEL